MCDGFGCRTFFIGGVLYGLMHMAELLRLFAKSIKCHRGGRKEIEMKKTHIFMLFLTCAICLLALASCCFGSKNNSPAQNEHSCIQGEEVKEKETVATCTAAGYYDAVTYCKECNKELSRKRVELPLAHHFENGVCLLCNGLESTKGLEFSLNRDGASYTAVGLNDRSSSDITIDLYNGLPVTAIAKDAFVGCTNILTLTLGKSVAEIGAKAFAGCTRLIEICNLSELQINVGETANGYVGKYARNVYTALSGNSKLCEAEGDFVFFDGEEEKYLVAYRGSGAFLRLPEAFNGECYVVYDYAFYGCCQLISVTVPAGVSDIRENAFIHCTKLAEIYNLSSLPIGKYNTDYGRIAQVVHNIYTSTEAESRLSTTEDGFVFHAVSGYNGLLYGYVGGEHEIIVPNTDTHGSYAIEALAFAGRSDITKITLSPSVKAIDAGAFRGCTALQYNVYNNGRYLGTEENPYYALIELEDTSARTLEIHADTVVIAADAFSDCEALSFVSIPNGLDAVALPSFSETSVITTLYNGVYYVGNEENPYLILLNAQKNRFATTYTIHPSTKYIASGAFSDCTSLESIVIPDSVEYIAAYAFSGCAKLQSVKLGVSVKMIGYLAFSGCTSLTSATFAQATGWYSTWDPGAMKGIPVSDSEFVSAQKAANALKNSGAFLVNPVVE